MYVHEFTNFVKCSLFKIMATFDDHLYLLCFLFCRSGEEIAVVYYRAGYSPNDYPTEKVQCTYTVHIHMY